MLLLNFSSRPIASLTRFHSLNDCFEGQLNLVRVRKELLYDRCARLFLEQDVLHSLLKFLTLSIHLHADLQALDTGFLSDSHVQIHEAASSPHDELLLFRDYNLAYLCADEVLASLQLDDGQDQTKKLLKLKIRQQV